MFIIDMDRKDCFSDHGIDWYGLGQCGGVPPGARLFVVSLQRHPLCKAPPVFSPDRRRLLKTGLRMDPEPGLP